MSLQTLLSILASSVGFVSALWFGAGAILIKADKIVKVSDDSWDAKPGIDETLVSQSAEYLAGGLLLAVSFALQIAAVQATSTNLQWRCPMFQSAWFVTPATVTASFLVSFPIFAWRRRILRRRVQALKQQK